MNHLLPFPRCGAGNSARVRLLSRLLAALLCCVAWLAPLSGATLEWLSLHDLISKSTAIVQGQVTGSSAAYSGSVIYTHYKVSIVQQWKGAPQSTVDVLVPGGTANGVRQTYPGAPQLTAGRQYVLFLWKSARGAVYTLGFTQGVFTLAKDAAGDLTVMQAPTTETVLEPGTGRVLRNEPISMPLAQLVSLIASGGAK